MAALAIVRVAQAQTSGTVLLVRVDGDEAIASRLLAELRNGEWRVIARAARSAEAHRTLDSLARASGASAALRARPSQLAVELWVAPINEHDKSASEEVSAGPRADVGVLALRVTEVLRARGLQPTAAEPASAPSVDAAPLLDASGAAKKNEGANVASEPQPSAAGPNPPAPTPIAAVPPIATTPAAAPPNSNPTPPQPTAAAATEPAKQEETAAPPATEPEPEREPEEAEVEVDEPRREPAPPPLLSLEIAPALLVNPGGLKPRFDGFGNVRVRPVAIVSFSAFVLAPILQSPVRTTAGSSDVRSLAAGGGADLQLPFSFWEFSAGLGAAALVTWVHGSSSAGYSVRDQTLRTAAVLARIGASYQLSAGVRASMRLLVGFAIPQLRIVLPDKVARWGEPFVVGTLGLDFNLL
jgi:hypothetical protein